MACQNFSYCNSCYLLGPTGPTGPSGENGSMPILVIGSVTTGNPGTEASVTITPFKENGNVDTDRTTPIYNERKNDK